MLRDGYKILDMDADYPESEYVKIHEKAIAVCRQHKAVLDLATSDVNVFLDDATNEVAQLVLACYPKAEMKHEGKNRWVIY